MSQEVRSVSIEPSAHEEEAPGRVVQNRAARYLTRKETSLCEKNVVDMITYDTKERNPSKEVRYEGI